MQESLLKGWQIILDISLFKLTPIQSDWLACPWTCKQNEMMRMIMLMMMMTMLMTILTLTILTLIKVVSNLFNIQM